MLHPQNYKTFSHSGKIGDIVYSLPVIKHIGFGDLYIAARNFILAEDTVSKETFNFIKPLLEYQKYIKKVFHKNNDSNINLDQFRRDIKAEKQIFKSYIKAFNIPENKYNEKWINCPKNKLYEVVIHRSPRYHNPKFPWKMLLEKFKNKCTFVGMKYEYDDFIKIFNKIPYHKPKDALELASIIAGSNLFIGNQSMPYAVAEGLKQNAIQETCDYMPNCILRRSNACYFENGKFGNYFFNNIKV